MSVDAYTVARKRLPTERKSITNRAVVGGFRFYITAGEFEDGSLGELFIKNAGREGSTVQGLLDGYATMLSIGIQHGAEFEMIARKFAHMNFEPNGNTENPTIPYAFSVIDYTVRWAAQHYGSDSLNDDLNRITEEMLEAQRYHSPMPQRPVVEMVCQSCQALMSRVNGHFECKCGSSSPL